MAGSRTTRAIVFCDVVASTALRQSLGDIVADRWFNDLFERIDLAVDEFEGEVVKWLGDGAMAVFPSAGGALDSAVRMQEVAHGPGPHTDVAPARLRVGVAIGDIAQAADGDWAGTPIVVAARLCDAADDDEIFATEIVRTLAGSRAEQETEPIGDLDLKGIADPVSVVRVGWTAPTPTASQHFPPSLEVVRRGPFVGRRALVSELHHHHRAGAWRALVVSGEPGMGKTRLVAELAHLISATGGAVVLGRCDPEIAIDYRPWIDALESLVESLDAERLSTLDRAAMAELGALVPALARRLATPPADTTTDADTRHAMVADAVCALLAAAAPITVVLDDVQWTDRRSLQIFRRVIAAGIADVDVIATYRDTDLDDVNLVPATLADLRRVEGVRRVALDGLDGEAVAEFLAAVSGGALDDQQVELARHVHERTAGNALFVGELARHLDETGALTSVASAADPAGPLLPEGLREVIQRRLGSLDAEISATLRIAAAVGPWFDLEVVEEAATLAGADGRAVLTQLEVAEAAGIVAEAGDGFDFRHGVIRDVLLDDLSTARRRRLHRGVVEVLEKKWARSTDDHLQELAHQHSQARTPEAASWQLRAATAAVEALDSAAEAFADRGLELLVVADPPDPVIECELLIARANGRRLAGHETIEEARVAFAAAAALGEQDRMARALLTLSIRSTADPQREHVEFLMEGLDRLDDLSSLRRWEVAVAIAVREGLDSASHLDVHRDRIASVIPHLDPADTAASQLAMRCARSLTSSNQPREACDIADRFATGCDGVDTERFPIDIGLSTMRLHLGNRTRSDQYLEHAARDRRRAYWFYDCQVRQRLAMRDLLDGRWDDAAEQIAAIAEIGGHDPNLTLSCALQQAWHDREVGAIQANLANIEAYREQYPDFAAIRCFEIGEVAEIGRLDEARRGLDMLAPDDFAGAGRGWLTMLTAGNLAWAAVAVDTPEHAPALRRILEPMGGQMGVIATGTNVLCAVDRLLAGLAALEGRHAVAVRLFAAARAQEQGVGSRPLEARTRHWWGRALLRRGDDAAARPHFDAAASIASDLRMEGLASQLAVLGV